MQIRAISPKTWRLHSLFNYLLILALFTVSFVFPYTAALWKKLDEQTFFFLNRFLDGSSFARVFWAIANHPLADWIEDAVIIVFFLFYIFAGKGKEERIRRTTHFFIMAILLAITIKFVNQGFFRYIIYFGRESPSISLDPIVLLSDHIDWMKVKCRSHSCFPSDHATTALFFAGYFCTIADRSLHRVLAVLYAAFLCFPRLVIGAHWVSDVLLGAGGIVIIVLSILFFSPLHAKLEHFFVRLFSLKKNYKRA